MPCCIQFVYDCTQYTFDQKHVNLNIIHKVLINVPGIYIFDFYGAQKYLQIPRELFNSSTVHMYRP